MHKITNINYTTEKITTTIESSFPQQYREGTIAGSSPISATASSLIGITGNPEVKVVRTIFKFAGFSGNDTGLFVKDNSKIAINDIIFESGQGINSTGTTSQMNFGLHASRNATLTIGDNVGVVGFKNGVVADNGGIIDAENLKVSGCTGVGILASNGSIIKTRGSSVNGCGVGYLSTNNSLVTDRDINNFEGESLTSFAEDAESVAVGNRIGAIATKNSTLNKTLVSALNMEEGIRSLFNSTVINGGGAAIANGPNSSPGADDGSGFKAIGGVIHHRDQGLLKTTSLGVTNANNTFKDYTIRFSSTLDHHGSTGSLSADSTSTVDEFGDIVG